MNKSIGIIQSKHDFSRVKADGWLIGNGMKWICTFIRRVNKTDLWEQFLSRLKNVILGKFRLLFIYLIGKITFTLRKLFI